MTVFADRFGSTAIDVPCADSNRRRVADEYGCRRGWFKGEASVLWARLGGYRAWRRVPWGNVSRLTFLCKGNICRSPYAELRARSLGANAVSFGLAVRADTCPARAIEAASMGSIDLSCHAPAAFDSYEHRSGDLIVGFEPVHLRYVMQAMPGCAGMMTLAGLWTQRLRPFMQDPFGLSPGYFERCYELIGDAVERMVANVVDAGGRFDGD